jgi:hypothetical protein
VTRPRTTPDAELLRAVLAEAAAAEAGAGAAGERREDDVATAGAAAAEADELVAYLRGHLSADDEARVERRLVADPAAARAVLDLAELEAAAAERADRDPEPAAPPADLGTAAAWRDLRRRLHRFSFGNAVNPLLLTLAAASLLVSVGLGVRLHRVEERLAAGATASRPAVNLATLDLTAGRRGAAEPAVAVAPGQPLWLGVTPQRRCPVYRVEVEGGGETRPLDGLRRDERGSLNALLYLPAGRYTLRVFGCQPEERLEEQDFRIETAPSESAPDGGGSDR